MRIAIRSDKFARLLRLGGGAESPEDSGHTVFIQKSGDAVTAWSVTNEARSSASIPVSECESVEGMGILPISWIWSPDWELSEEPTGDTVRICMCEVLNGRVDESDLGWLMLSDSPEGIRNGRHVVASLQRVKGGASLLFNCSVAKANEDVKMIDDDGDVPERSAVVEAAALKSACAAVASPLVKGTGPHGAGCVVDLAGGEVRIIGMSSWRPARVIQASHGFTHDLLLTVGARGLVSAASAFGEGEVTLWPATYGDGSCLMAAQGGVRVRLAASEQARDALPTVYAALWRPGDGLRLPRNRLARFISVLGDSEEVEMWCEAGEPAMHLEPVGKGCPANGFAVRIQGAAEGFRARFRTATLSRAVRSIRSAEVVLRIHEGGCLIVASPDASQVSVIYRTHSFDELLADARQNMAGSWARLAVLLCEAKDKGYWRLPPYRCRSFRQFVETRASLDRRTAYQMMSAWLYVKQRRPEVATAPEDVRVSYAVADMLRRREKHVPVPARAEFDRIAARAVSEGAKVSEISDTLANLAPSPQKPRRKPQEWRAVVRKALASALSTAGRLESGPLRGEVGRLIEEAIGIAEASSKDGEVQL